jgi:microcystin-dependent protein
MPLLGEIKIVSFNFAPIGWALCNGQLLPVSQYTKLAALFGTKYGGDGQNKFGLPDLGGRAPAGFGTGFTLGQVVGEERHTLTLQQLAPHSHPMFVSATGAELNATGRNPAGHSPATAFAATDPIAAVNIWGTGPKSVTFNDNMIGLTGGGQSHENRQPFLALNFCVCLVGDDPPR